MAVFEASVQISCPIEQVFEFLLRPANLQQISPPQMGLHFVSAPEVIEMGSRLEFKLQGFGTVQHVVHEIIVMEHPRRFVETQVKGPLKRWIHEHILQVHDDGGTSLTDRIEFEPPGGLIGLMVTESRIRDSLEDNFDLQHLALKKRLQ